MKSSELFTLENLKNLVPSALYTKTVHKYFPACLVLSVTLTSTDTVLLYWALIISRVTLASTRKVYALWHVTLVGGTLVIVKVRLNLGGLLALDCEDSLLNDRFGVATSSSCFKVDWSKHNRLKSE